jgi:hypothetical protein
MNDIQNILNQISIINKKNAEIMEASGGRFNMFGVLGVDHYENTHSAIICEFLNPKGSHGLKDQFLKAFIEQYVNQNIDSTDFFRLFITKEAKAVTEYPTQVGRIDILIEDNNGRAIIIENKIYAIDQWEQLSRYNKFALAKYKTGNYIILYLTLNGVEASEQSSKDVDYFKISHSDFIIKWLEKCVSISSRFPLVRETIIQYINHLKKLTNQDMSTNFKNEIIELLSKSPENIEAAFLVVNSINHVKQLLINDLKRIVEEIASEEHLDFTFKGNWNESWQGFNFTRKEWKYIKIGFEFQSKSFGALEYGINWKSNEKPNEIRELISKIFGGKRNEGWPFYTAIESPYYDWVYSSAPWIGLLNGETKKLIKSKITFITERVKDIGI